MTHRADAGPEESGPTETLSFEAALARLEAVVERLEDGELALETALQAFEDGVRLSRRCAEQLDAAQRRVEILVGDQGLESRPFEEPEDAD